MKRKVSVKIKANVKSMARIQPATLILNKRTQDL